MTTSQKTGGLGSRVMLGAGSLSKRRKGIYWLVYKDEAGRLVQTNSRTSDWDEAERMLARAVYPMLAARLERIRELAYGKAPLKAKKEAEQPDKIRVTGVVRGIPADQWTEAHHEAAVRLMDAMLWAADRQRQRQEGTLDEDEPRKRKPKQRGTGDRAIALHSSGDRSSSSGRRAAGKGDAVGRPGRTAETRGGRGR